MSLSLIRSWPDWASKLVAHHCDLPSSQPHLTISTSLRSNNQSNNEPLKQIEPLVSHCLNLNSTYASTFSSGTRELMQNWWDACAKLIPNRSSNQAINQPQATSRLRVEVRQQPGEKSYHFSAWIDDIIVGLAIASDADRQLVLINFWTNIAFDKLILGVSSKANSSNGNAVSAGVFGEGMKVEINRLIAEGSTVQFRNGDTIWNWDYISRGEHRVLNVNSHRQSVYSPHLIIAISNIPTKYARVIPQENYLFLQPHAQLIRSTIDANRWYSGCAVLPNHAGKVFLHGILISDKQQRLYPTFGISFDGNKKSFDKLKVGRDRDALDAVKLADEIPYMLMENVTTNVEAAKKLTELVYNTLNDHSNSAMNLLSLWNKSSLQLYFNSLHDYFMFKHSLPGTKTPVPVLDELERAEIEYLDYLPVTVSRDLCTTLRDSPNCLTITKAWAEREKYFDSLPQAQLGPIEQAIANEITADIRGVFMSEVADNIQWRVFPDGNVRPVYHSRSRNLFIIDCTSLKINEIHTRMTNEDKDFRCDGVRCSCLKQYLMSQMLTVITQNQPHDRPKYERKMLRYYMSLTAVNRLEMVGRSDQHWHAKNEEEAKCNGVTNSAPAAPDHPPWLSQPSVNRPCAISPAHSELLDFSDPPVAQRPASSIFQDAALEFNETAVKDTFKQVGEAYQDNQLAGQGIISRSKKIDLSPAVLHSLMRSCIDSLKGPELDLSPVPWKEAASINVLIEQISCSPPVLDLLRDPVKQKSMEALALFNLTIIESIYQHVMGELGVYQVFYDPWTNVIAFNRQNVLWFNVASKRGNPCTSPRLYIAAWFLTICHELAHVHVGPHNAAFAAAFSFIVWERSKAFWSQIPKLEGDMSCSLNGVMREVFAQVFA